MAFLPFDPTFMPLALIMVVAAFLRRGILCA